jgi:hypothetical protein
MSLELLVMLISLFADLLFIAAVFYPLIKKVSLRALLLLLRAWILNKKNLTLGYQGYRRISLKKNSS